jgi:glycosyltransferase involved in cell wall biosynthesis
MNTPSASTALASPYPPFSVLMSVYARERPANLDASLDSLARSNEPVTELVLVEDGALGEDLRDIIESYRSRLNIHSVRLPTNRGLPAALNAGLAECRHEIVARFDSDDLNMPQRFGTQLAYLSVNPAIAMVGSAVEEFDADTGEILSRRVMPLEDAAIRQFAKRRSPMNHPSVMFRKQVVLDAGGYPDIRYLEDYALWAQCIVNGARLANLQEPLVRMRSGIGQMGRRRGWVYIRSEIQFARVFRRAGFLSSFDTLTFLLLRIPPRILPASLLLKLYAHTLRQQRA